MERVLFGGGFAPCWRIPLASTMLCRLLSRLNLVDDNDDEVRRDAKAMLRRLVAVAVCESNVAPSGRLVPSARFSMICSVTSSSCCDSGVKFGANTTPVRSITSDVRRCCNGYGHSSL
eukprot:CAMPEP_0172397206 /NCGR_PEP_ID=MMETSP1061-20121228/29338_1 /TAXON_ID=37318 /ORGANISM="Pseudo-nitzschia pungens, Strain cf. pungens" /LENGTH=117 /DNA_ID=CAMNT_0013129297 /DNA_START=1997 /DNA_END=2350 /DNA_ORIENTATION=-